jgi:putative addiction module component (TIGR02574 family)
MSTKELAEAALALPVSKRVALAQSLWASVYPAAAGEVNDETAAAVREADRRDAELSSGKKKPLTHDQLMRAARRSLQ